jgi:uncharacterized RDD family membrane protein YckC
MATGIDPDIRYCSQCGRPGASDELARFGQTMVCPSCKDLFVQKLREGVAPHRPLYVYGGFWIRLLATIIDNLIVGIAGGAVQLLLLGPQLKNLMNLNTQEPVPPEEVLAAFGAMMGTLALSMVVSVAIESCYESFFISRVGATPGKMVFGMKVIRPNGDPISLGRAFGRYFAKWLSKLTFYIGFIIAGFDAEKRAMHDMIVDTRVVMTNTPPPIPYYAPTQV